MAFILLTFLELQGNDVAEHLLLHDCITALFGMGYEGFVAYVKNFTTLTMQKNIINYLYIYYQLP
jgi:hypothetical protein